VPELALYAIGRDRPGIVASIAAVLLDHGVNIEDSQATILRGHFALVQILDAPDDADSGALLDDLMSTARELGLEWIYVNEVSDVDVEPPVEPTHILSVYGGDHPGIVHAVASALAERGIGITDLNSRVVPEGEQPLYVLMLEVALPEGAEADELRTELDGVGKREGVEVSMRELEDDPL
jgi:glycine cleavage system transcriptional repressor